VARHKLVSPGCYSHECAQRVWLKSHPHPKQPAAVAQASWYGPGLYGGHLACGGTLTPQTWGVAHKTLPCGARVRLCHNGCVTAPVVDRGPYVAGREFDLTAPVKNAVGLPGTGAVRYRVVG
jgi:rare lipoprotein A (peptidoglycan hydrolase)